jgi:hypothetical protein
MLTRINLLCHSYNHSSLYLLSLEQFELKIPHYNIVQNNQDENFSLDSTLKDLFCKYINIDYTWSRPSLLDVDIFKSDDNILQTQIYYSSYVPYATSIFNSYWYLADDMVCRSRILGKILAI